MTFTILLPPSVHQIAQQFGNIHHHCYEKERQVYLNTLAVYSVDYYLKCLGIETDLEASDSWNPVIQILADTADLIVRNRGKLECRAVSPQAGILYVPPEVWEDRIGYVAVVFEQSLREATLLGFVQAVTVEEFPISQLQSLDEMLEQLSQTKSNISQLIEKPVVNLRQWLQGIFTYDWETVETIIRVPQIAFRNTSSLRSISPVMIERCKLLCLEQDSERLALLIGLKPADESKISISVEIHPTSKCNCLPQSLKLIVLDVNGEALIEAQARENDNYIRVELLAEIEDRIGEYFDIKVALGDICITEKFVI